MAFPIVSGVTFKLVENFSGYCVGTDGSVWSRLVTKGQGRGVGWVTSLSARWRRLRASPVRNGYCRVSLCYACGTTPRHNKRGHISRFVHNLVLGAFVGPCPPGMECRHLNNDSSDNRLVNLAWGTPKENAADRVPNGTSPVGEKNPGAKLTARQVRHVRLCKSLGLTYRDLSIITGLSLPSIVNVCTRRTWKSVV